MFKLTVLKNYNENKKVKIDYIDGTEEETRVRTMDTNELKSWIDDSKLNEKIKITFEEQTEINTVSLYCFEGGIDVMLNNYTYNKQGEENYKDELLKTYNKFNSALDYAKEQIKKIDNCYSTVIVEW